MTNHTTHYACQTRIQRDGASVRCCKCSPHDDCDYKPRCKCRTWACIGIDQIKAMIDTGHHPDCSNAPESRISNPFEKIPDMWSKKGILE